MPLYLELQRVPVQNREIVAFPRVPIARHLPDAKQDTEESGSAEALEPAVGDMSCHRWTAVAAACGPDAIAPGASASSPPAAATPAMTPARNRLRMVVRLRSGPLAARANQETPAPAERLSCQSPRSCSLSLDGLRAGPVH